jgi:hypothetical protein
VSLVHSRLHRIRPVWLYNDSAPTVLRDVDFDVRPARCRSRKSSGTSRSATTTGSKETRRVANVEKEETFEIQLAKDEFPRRPDNRSLDFEPMGRQGSACCSCA